MFRRFRSAVVFLVPVALLATVFLWLRAPAPRASSVWIPLATRVERAGLIVTGRIDSIEPRQTLLSSGIRR